MTKRRPEDGRPPLPPGVAKTEQIALRVTPADKAKVERLGVAMGGSAGDWLTAQIRKAKEPKPQS